MIPSPALEQVVIIKCLREASFGPKRQFAEQWHSGGVVGQIPKDFIDSHVRGAGTVVDGVFRLGNPWETEGSSYINAVPDPLMSVTFSPAVFHLDAGAVVYTVQVHCKCFKIYVTSCIFLVNTQYYKVAKRLDGKKVKKISNN